MKIWSGRIIFSVTTLLLILMSFGFSNQSGSGSTRLSKGILAKAVQTEYFDSMTYKEKAQIVKDSDLYTRKAAHFSEYALLGISLYFLFRSWLVKDRKKPYIYTLLACLVFASADEIHQMFSAGRTASAIDVLIDFSGCAAACLVIFLIQRVISRKKSAAVRKIR